MGQLNQKKIKNYFALCFIVFLSFTAKSNEIINNNDIITKTLTITNTGDIIYKTNKNIYKKDPLALYSIDFTRIFNKDYKFIEISENFTDKSRPLANGEYYKVRGLDNNEYLFDGSFLIEFKSLPDFNFYASVNRLDFLTDLSDINMGIFKSQNTINLKATLNKLKEDDNIESIELNLYHSKINQ